MKKNFSFTIDEEIIKELSSYCEKRLITKSKLINKIITDFLKNNKISNENES